VIYRQANTYQNLKIDGIIMIRIIMIITMQINHNIIRTPKLKETVVILHSGKFYFQQSRKTHDSSLYYCMLHSLE
jgi:hypothetical protein